MKSQQGTTTQSRTEDQNWKVFVLPLHLTFQVVNRDAKKAFTYNHM